MSATLQEFLLDGAEETPVFQTSAHYDPDGDCIEFLFKSEAYRGRRLDDLVTVYVGRESGAVVGCLIKGVSKFVGSAARNLPGVAIFAKAGSMELGYLFALRVLIAGAELSDKARETYGALNAEAGKNRLTAYFKAIEHQHDTLTHA